MSQEREGKFLKETIRLHEEVIVQLGDDLNAKCKETVALRAELSEAKRDMHSFQVQLKSFDKFHWELVDLFDKDAGGVSPLHYVKERIVELKDRNAALLTDSAELRAELAEKTAEVERMKQQLAAEQAGRRELQKLVDAGRDFRFGRVAITFTNNGWECYRFGDGYLDREGNYISGAGITWVHKSARDALAVAIAANWLPAEEGGGG